MREVIEEAFRRQGQAQDAAEKAAKLSDLARAAEELGLDPAELEAAEEVVRMRAEARERAAAAAATTRRTSVAGLALGGLGVAAAAALAALLVGHSGPAPAEPVATETPLPVSATTWTVDHNPATEADATFAEGRAALTVTRFGAEADGTFWANLETRPELDWRGARAVQLTVEGTLPSGRLYLENGDERWRSPAFGVPSTAAPVELELRDFERQLRTDGEWKVVDQAPPDEVRTASFKFGWWVNDVDRAGTVVIRDVTVRR